MSRRVACFVIRHPRQAFFALATVLVTAILAANTNLNLVALIFGALFFELSVLWLWSIWTMAHSFLSAQREDQGAAVGGIALLLSAICLPPSLVMNTIVGENNLLAEILTLIGVFGYFASAWATAYALSRTEQIAGRTLLSARYLFGGAGGLFLVFSIPLLSIWGVQDRLAPLARKC